MTHRIIPVAPFLLTIFGATGDLARRKLLPALYLRDLDGQIPPEARILGVARRALDDAAFRASAREALERFAPAALLDEATLSRFLARLRYLRADAAEAAGWKKLAATIAAAPPALIRVHYLAVEPALFAPIVERLRQSGLAEGARLVVEKPIGRDLAGARALNAQISQVFDEARVYRIDHYLGKETVQNLMALRFANVLFEPLWNARYIEHVQITAAESVGLEGRAEYYDGAGAMRDMAQNHLLQLLCLTAMEPPYAYAADAIRDEKLKVLRSLKPLAGEAARKATARGRYLSAGGQPGYLEELGRADSRAETYVAIRAEVASMRWAGTPFFLRTGKRLRARMTEIFVRFRRTPHSIFPEAAAPRANYLCLRLQPNEGVELSIMTKDPGPGGFRLRRTPLDMSFAGGRGVKWRMPDAYERLLMDVVRGDQTLFMRHDEVEAAWAWIDPIQEAWRETDIEPEGYDIGGSGPPGALQLIAGDDVRWRDITA